MSTYMSDYTGSQIDYSVENSHEHVNFTLFKAEANITRPTNTTQYTASDIINGNGASELIEIDLSSIAGANTTLLINKVRVYSSYGSANNKLVPIVYIFNSPTITGQSLSDNEVFDSSYSELSSKLEASFVFLEKAGLRGIDTVSYSSTLYSVNLSQVIPEVVTTDADGKIYVALLATGYYSPLSAEIFTVEIEGVCR